MLVGTTEPEPLGAAPVLTFVDENVDGADMTCVCRRGSLSAYLQPSKQVSNKPWIFITIINNMEEFIPDVVLTAAGTVHLLRYWLIH